MLKGNTRVQEAAKRLQEVFTSENPDKAAVETAFEEFGTAIAASVVADYESAHGDQNILAQRGFRVLTSEERTYYQGIINAGKAVGTPIQSINSLIPSNAMPTTIIEDVYRMLTDEHPLLAAINFQSVEYLTKWILNDHTVNNAAWGPINSAVQKLIDSSFRVIDIAQCKLSAYAMIDMDMLDLGPTFLDNYVRTFLKEAIFGALEDAIISGNGLDQPIGLDRDIHRGVSVSQSTGYPQKTPIALTSFAPTEYGPALAKLAVSEAWYTSDSTGAVTAAATAANADGSAKSGYTKHGGRTRIFDEATLICNQVDYLSKIMPATTVLAGPGTYARDNFPFPTQVIRSAQVPTGKAILCLPKEYFLGVGTSKEATITFSDEFKFLEDKRVFKAKMHAMGTPYDDTVSLLLDISNLEAAAFLTKDITPTV